MFVCAVSPIRLSFPHFTIMGIGVRGTEESRRTTPSLPLALPNFVSR